MARHEKPHFTRYDTLRSGYVFTDEEGIGGICACQCKRCTRHVRSVGQICVCPDCDVVECGLHQLG